MEPWIRFPVFIIASYLAFGVIIYFVLRKKEVKTLFTQILTIGLIVVVGGMIFAKVGQNSGWPWWIYYPVPMLLTVFLPPFYFRMKGREIVEYLILSFFSAPIIHLVFSFFLGWHDYMPFIKVPSIWEII